MRLVAVGLSHRTAPIEMRERLAVDPSRVPFLLGELRERRLGREAVILSTCNRVEVYAVPGERVEADRLARWLAESGGLHARSVAPHIYRFEEREALRHLFRVTSSLDSMIVGEPQIVAQVKAAYRMAAAHQATGPVMNRVMDRALQVAKRVRTETAIGQEAVSVGRAGVELAAQVLGSLERRSALIIGAGAHAKVIARALLDRGLCELVVANRTFQRGVALAERFGGSAIPLNEVERYLTRVDIVLSSAAGGRTLIDRSTLAPVMRSRRYRSLVMIDLAVPRNIAPEVNDLDGVYRFDVDDLVRLADEGLEKRRAEAALAEAIVSEETERSWRELVGRAAHDRIGEVFRRADRIRAAEVERAISALTDLSDADRRVVEAMTRAIVKKVLHLPVSEARALAESGRFAELETLLHALGADEAPPATGERRND